MTWVTFWELIIDKRYTDACTVGGTLSAMPIATRLALLAAVTAAVLIAGSPGAASTPALRRVSVSSDGSDPYGDSSWPSLSADGRFVAFQSDASNLVPMDTNNSQDIFVYDRFEGSTKRVSVASGGTEANGGSWSPKISADGRYVAFISGATNLDPIMVSGAFVHDRLTGQTELVSVRTDGAPGQYPVHEIDLSVNGRFVAMSSSGLTPDVSRDAWDIYLRDLESGTTTLASRTPDGSLFQAPSGSPSLSGDGRILVFTAGNFVPTTPPPNSIPGLYLYDLVGGGTSYVFLADGEPALSYGTSPGISDDGRYVSFLGRAVGSPSDAIDPWNDVFVYDRETMTVEKVSLSVSGGDPGGAASSAAISANGRYVTYSSDAPDLIESDTNACADVFVWDSLTEEATRVSVAIDGGNANDLSRMPTISADGQYVAFESWARNLVADDHNGDLDVFLAGPRQDSAGVDSVTRAGGAEARCGPDPGDTDCSGALTAVDALGVLRKVAELRPWGECVRLVGTVNCDGQLNAVDALWILRAVAGLMQLPTSCGK